MVILSEFRMGKYGDIHHQEDAPHFSIMQILDKKQTEVPTENAPTCLSPVEEQEVQTSSEITSEFTSEITSEFTSEPAIIEEIPLQAHSKIERKNTIDDEMIMPIEEIGTNL